MTDRAVTTYTMWSLFRNCRKAAQYRYVLDLVPIERDRNLAFGSLVHEALETWHRTRDLAATLDVIDRACANRTANEDERRTWHLATAMLRGYAARYPTEDFEVVAVSFDPRETPALAAGKRAMYLERYSRPGAEAGWHFLTGGQASIDALTHAAGFRYAWDEPTQQFAHPSGVIVVTPDGRPSRYLFGIDYGPRDLRLAIVDAGCLARVGDHVEEVPLIVEPVPLRANTDSPRPSREDHPVGPIDLLPQQQRRQIAAIERRVADARHAGQGGQRRQQIDRPGDLRHGAAGGRWLNKGPRRSDRRGRRIRCR